MTIEIKPESLAVLAATCDNSEWLGDIVRALGGQEADLDYGQRQALAIILADGKSRADAIELRKSRVKERVAKHRRRATDATDATQCDSDDDYYLKSRKDPVGAAMEICLTDKDKDRHIFAGLLGRIGRERFCDVLDSFRAEICAGEIPDRAAACLTARLNRMGERAGDGAQREE